MLSNEKYTGDVKLLKSGKSDVHYLASGNNPAITSKETFKAVQIESARGELMWRKMRMETEEKVRDIVQNRGDLNV